MGSTLLRRATVADGTLVDVRLEGGAIAAVGQLDATPDDGSGAAVDDVVDLDGYVLLPAAVEPHAHLDKAFLAEVLGNLTGDLMGAIVAIEAGRHLLGVAETVERAERAARLMAANGYTAVRTHADVTIEHGLTSVEALAEVRARLADVIDIEIVALCGWPVTGAAGADQRRLLVDALAAGADLVGGCPHLELFSGGDVVAATDVLLGIAAEHGRAVDLHTDETLDPAVCGLEHLARAVSGGFPHRVTASHCVSLGVQPEPRQRSIAEAVAAAGIGVVALPHTNLFLQGRAHQQSMPRGLTALGALRRAGVDVAAGADNLQDPFNPVGRACPFETAALMVLAGHFTPADAYASVSTIARRVVSAGRGWAGLVPRAGDAADLLAVRATNLRHAVASGPSCAGDRVVWRRGVAARSPG